MSNSTLFRLSGVALLLGGLLGTAAVALHPASMVDPANVPVHLALYTAVMLVALGLPGFYARQSAQAGLLGLCGTVVLFFGLVFADPIHSVLEFTAVPVLAADPATQPLLDGPPPGLMGPLMVALPVLLVGLVLVAISTWRAGVLPRWPSIMAVIAVVLVVIGFATSGPDGNESPVWEVGAALLYLTMAAFGYLLVADTARRPRVAADRAPDRVLVAR